MAKNFTFSDVSKKHYTAEELEDKKKQEESLSTFEPLNFSDIPETLDDEAKKEWQRLSFIVADLPISELDRAIFENICMYTSILRRAREELKDADLIVDDRKINPLITLINQASKELRALASNSGLSIDSRLRIKAPNSVVEPDDFFAAMFKENQNE